MAASNKKLRFHIRFEEADEGGYLVTIPEMPSCVTQAESVEEGLRMIWDALEGLLAVAVEHDDPIPEQFQQLANELTVNSASARRGRQATRSQAG